MKKKTSPQKHKERQKLKKFLAQYYKAKKQQGILQERFLRMQSEYGETAPSEIEAKIKDQKQQAQKIAFQIMEILELLPQGSTERAIMELRHLDCKTWAQVQRAVYLTNSPCYDQYNKGLDMLLENSRVRTIIGLKIKGKGG